MPGDIIICRVVIIAHSSHQTEVGRDANDDRTQQEQKPRQLGADAEAHGQPAHERGNVLREDAELAAYALSDPFQVAAETR